MTKTMPEPPQLTVLQPLVDKLPPFIARKAVKYFTGGAISAKKLANDDYRAVGPAVRMKIGDTVVYPTPFFLAYLESQGISIIEVPKL